MPSSTVGGLRGRTARTIGTFLPPVSAFIEGTSSPNMALESWETVSVPTSRQSPPLEYMP